MTIIQKGEPMSDLISRKAAIDAILHITNCKSVRELFEYNQEHHLTEMWSGGVNDAIDAVIGVESAIDNNVGTKLSTNLASLGTDCSEFPNNSDAISRQAAIDALNELRESTYEDNYGVFDSDDAINVIASLPPKEPKRGKWIKTARWGRVYYCNQCRNYLDFDGVNAGRGNTNFCPNCGAKMEVTNGN